MIGDLRVGISNEMFNHDRCEPWVGNPCFPFVARHPVVEFDEDVFSVVQLPVGIEREYDLSHELTCLVL